jgi:protein LSM12
MIINDSVRIDAPYRAEDCKAPADQAHTLERVKKVLENERRKIADKSRGPSAPPSGVATPTGRKGG